ncbi:hypothetical protein [Streptomyces sp. DSM 40484]|uniref:hypothetical protein n=1 Tax=Streptomyces kroppenstedtii TaxID=3051181 RepID=UPI0028D6FB99|nr:hypothetical protein [Streptomyces sp. DSM 40484]
MSSNYAALCLSHDPAIIVHDPGFNRPEQAEEAIRAGINDHRNCDLLIGRFSYPLIEVGCPGIPGGGCSHRSTEWVDSGWLRVLAHARAAGALPPAVASHHDLHCWTEQRVWRLREELGLEPPVSPEPSATLTAGEHLAKPPARQKHPFTSPAWHPGDGHERCPTRIGLADTALQCVFRLGHPPHGCTGMLSSPGTPESSQG